MTETHTPIACVIGASGGIGSAFVEQLQNDTRYDKIVALSRSHTRFASDRVVSGHIDLTDEPSIEDAAALTAEHGTPTLIIVATGLLHDEHHMPEKAMKELNANQLAHSYAINTIGPALVGKHFLPLLPRDTQSIFAALSARVGSVSDNQIGGWYSYRAAKAALNMVLKNFAIEIGRKHKQAIIVGLQPGTVDTALSEPFQSHVKAEKLFSPVFATEHLLATLHGLSPDDTGKLYDWDGKEWQP
ncbi:MAG: hypothetical protein CMM94_06255 [Rickettsiales bacterium]|nr:hypothetical protein [Rickettsiales bacterium]